MTGRFSRADAKPCPYGVDYRIERAKKIAGCWCGYITELLFTSELDMLTFGGMVIDPSYRTTSVTAQLQAVKSGSAIAILPCYMGDLHPEIEMILPNQIGLKRTYWIAFHRDLVRSHGSVPSSDK